MATFAERFNEALSLRQMTAAELSRETKINEGTISQYRRGEYEPKQRRLHLFANILRVPVDWLLGADVPLEEVTPDEEDAQLLEAFKTRPEMKLLFSKVRNAPKEDVEQAARIIDALKKG